MQVYSIHVQVDTTLHNKLLLLVPDVFCTADKPSQSQSTQAMLPNENRNQWNSTCLLYYTRVNWSVLACFHATPNLGMRLIWVGFHSLYIQGDCYGVFWYIRLSSGWTDIHTGLYAVSLTAGHGAVDSWWFMSIPQLKEEMEIDRNTAGQWSVLLGLAWAGSVCYHGNEQGVCVTTAMKCTLVF